jgi:hypothetical protein
MSGSFRSQFAVVGESTNHVAVVCGSVVMVLWRGPQEPAVCASLYELAVRAARAQGVTRVAVVSVVGEGSRPPNKEARDALARLYEDPEGVIHRVAVVIPGAGFVAAGIRSIVIGLRQMVTHKGNQEVFQSIDKALPWVTEGLVTARETPVAVSALLARLATLESREDPSQSVPPSRANEL